MKLSTLTGLFVAGLFTVSTQAALYDRGGGMIYDDLLDITWLQDANYAQTSGYDDDGFMNWGEANAWADQLEYGGYNDWRLTSARLTDPISGYDVTTGELGHMYHNNLANPVNTQHLRSDPIISFTDGNSGTTTNILNLTAHYYWYSEGPYGVEPGIAPWNWIAPGYDFGNGHFAELSVGDQDVLSWAVRDGDVSAVPVPAAVWLFGSGLLGLVGVARRKKS